jgi:hypothetical protein
MTAAASFPNLHLLRSLPGDVLLPPMVHDHFAIFLAEGHLLLPPKVNIKFNQRFKEKTLTRLSDSKAAGFHTADYNGCIRKAAILPISFAFGPFWHIWYSIFRKDKSRIHGFVRVPGNFLLLKFDPLQ